MFYVEQRLNMHDILFRFLALRCFIFILQQKFNIEDDVRVKKVIFDQLNRQYRSYRHKLHLHYLKSKKEEGNILEKSPNGVNRNDWKILVEYFESKAFQVILCTIFFSMFA